MAQEPIFEQTGPAGYISADAKSTYSTCVGVIAGVCVLAQFVLPSVIMMIVMPGAMFMDVDFSLPHPDRAVYWHGRIWCPGEDPRGGSLLQSVRLGGDDQKQDDKDKSFRLRMQTPWLLPDGDRLWLVGPGTVGTLQDGREETVRTRVSLETMAPPFLLKGSPATIADVGNGMHLWTFEEGEWIEGPQLRLMGDDDAAAEEEPVIDELSDPMEESYLGENSSAVQVVADGDKLFVFMKYQETLYFHEGLPTVETEKNADPEKNTPDDAGWQKVGEAGWNWRAALLYGEPVVFNSDVYEPSDLAGMRRVGGQWQEFFHHPSDDDDEFDEFSVVPLDKPGEFAIVTGTFGTHLEVIKVRNGKVVESDHTGKGPFSAMAGVSMWKMMLPGMVTMGLSVAVALVIAWMMGRYRVPQYGHGVSSVQFASLTRRGLAKGVDSLIPSLPIAGVWMVAWNDIDFNSLMTDPESFFKTILMWLGWMLAAFAWWLLVLVIYSVMEGNWGATPGKLLTGIRVTNLEFHPCGFWRALGRNLLMIADGFFSWMVGIVLIAYTEKWQRLGDMAVGTIVVRGGGEIFQTEESGEDGTREEPTDLLF